MSSNEMDMGLEHTVSKCFLSKKFIASYGVNLLVIPGSLLDFGRPINLLDEDQAGQLMGERHL